jgi:hypothetical protein
LFDEMLKMLLPSAFIVWSVSTPELKHGTSALGRVEVNTIRPSGSQAGVMSLYCSLAVSRLSPVPSSPIL